MNRSLFNISIFILITFNISCKGQDEIIEFLDISNIEFESIFGYSKKPDAERIYCLQGTGFFRAPKASATDSLIKSWIKNHPEAKLVPVYSFGPVMDKDPKLKQTYCWLVSDRDTLNLHLVKKGLVPGGTMMRPKLWTEMTRKEKKLWYDGDKPDEQVHISDEEYNNFIEMVKSAEKFAQTNKIGIWNENND